MPRETLSLNEARRIALAAQGFDRPRPRAAASARHLMRTIRQLGLLQIDFVNVLLPAHYLIPFSRLGAYRRTLFDDVVYRQGDFTEQWAHEASIVPMETWPLLSYRRESFRVRPWFFEKILNQHTAYADEVLNEIRKRGPLGADDLHVPDGASRRLENSWIGTLPRATLEAHFARGRLAVAERRPNFSRTYDLAERLIPGEHFERKVDREPAQRELLLRAAQAYGVGTAADLGDYYRMPIKEARAGLAALVAGGELSEVRVEGWRDAAYLHPNAKLPKELRATALLSPFDPVVWFRPRAERLFDFEYRIEIYTPQEKRRWGYYVLPFLMGDRLVARVDLKADRAARRLLVPAAHVEPHAAPGAVAKALAAELRVLADWLGLDTIAVERHGKFARQLAAAVRPFK